MRKSFTYNGKRYEVTGKTQHEIDEKYFQKRLELESLSCVYTVNEWCNIWLERYKKNVITKKNYSQYQIRINKYILPFIGDRLLNDVTPSDCQQIINNTCGLSKTYISKISCCLKAIFKSAVVEELIVKNPAENIVSPKGHFNERRSLTNQETEIFLKTIPISEHGLYFSIMFYCGLRPHECGLIQGKDVEDGMLHIRGIKNANADRYVPIPSQLIFPSLDLEEYLFPNLTETKMKRWWKVFKREMNIVGGCKVYRNKVYPPFIFNEDVTPYCLRHTFCTNLEKAGISINIARQLMGHSSIELTSKIYTHTSNQEIKKSCNLLESYYTTLPHPHTKK